MNQPKRSKRTKKRRAPQVYSRGFVAQSGGAKFQSLYNEKSRFPNLPHEFECALDYYYHDERTGGQTTQASRIAPLTEFNTQLPRYAAELYQIYRHCRIMSIEVHMEIVNTSSTEPLVAAVGVLPLANANAITNPQTIASVPGSVFKQIGLATGMSRTTIHKRYITCKELGELTLGSQTYLQTYSEALSAAIWTELPTIYMGVIAAKNGATWTGIVDYRLKFHLRFSEYNIPALGLKKSAKTDAPPKDMSEEEMDESDWVQPPVTRVRKNHGYASSIKGSK